MSSENGSSRRNGIATKKPKPPFRDDARILQPDPHTRLRIPSGVVSFVRDGRKRYMSQETNEKEKGNSPVVTKSILALAPVKRDQYAKSSHIGLCTTLHAPWWW